jgi:hypothetical protein
MESLTGPKEIWWFNGFDSPEDQRQVAEAYEKNAPFSAALKENSDRKAPVTGKVIEVIVQYRPDLISGVPWILGHWRFLVIAVTRDRPSSDGTVFQAADGTFFVFAPARTRKQADRLAASIPGSTVLVIRPALSFPAKDWVAADPQFWRGLATTERLSGFHVECSNRVTPPCTCDTLPPKESAMFHWLVRLWRKLDALMRHRVVVPSVSYRRSNLHGRRR